jgi:hypothetical protein
MFGKVAALLRELRIPDASDTAAEFRPSDDPLANLALTLDRVAHVPQARAILDQIVESDARAGFLFLWGSTKHALDAFARRLSYLPAEDPDDPVLSRIRVRSTVRECRSRPFFELGGGRPMKGLAPWRELLPENAGHELDDTLVAASRSADLWLVAFRVPQSERGAFLDNHCRTLAASLAAEREWDSGKFLFVYCIDGDRGENENHPPVKPHPARVMHDWSSIGAGDIDLWFQRLNEHRHKPALRAVDLDRVCVEVRKEICGRDGDQTGFMRPALDTLTTMLPMAARWS